MAEDNAVKNFLEEFSGEKEANPFEDNLKDPFEKVEVPDFKEEVSEEQKEEKSLPFNKDPKIQRFIEKEINKRMSEFKPSETDKEIKKENDEVVESLIAVIGNDTPEKRRAVEALKNRLDEGTRKITEWEETKNQEERADKEAEEELLSAFENIEDNYDVDISSNTPQAKKTRQEFISFVEKIAPKDRYGEVIDFPDMNSAWETFSEIKKSSQSPSRAKELASRGMSRSSEAPTGQTVKRIDWNTVENYMDTLKP